jgi:ubiquitin carboxyl-terminal hydrolase L5
MAEDWCTVESDPGVFTEMIESFGVKGVQVEELYALDEHLLADLQPVYGLIFLFKWQQEKDRKGQSDPNADVFFARQMITNACATQAILNILFNQTEVALGSELDSFKEMTKEFSSELKGLSISNSEVIKKAHNSFARPEVFSIQHDKDDEKDDAFHFIAYIHSGGVLYELDGLQLAPISHGAATAENWLQIATPIIQQRIEKYSATEIRFNLMALVKNRIEALNSKVAELEEKRQGLEAQLTSEMDVEGQESKVMGEIQELNDRIVQVQNSLDDEKVKRENWKKENVRRRHNYVPFLFNLLKILADKDMLMPLVEKAKEKKKERIAKKQEQSNKDAAADKKEK